MSQLLRKLDLHGRLKKHAFEHALIATYNFSARFFEDYVLENFKGLQDNGNISVFLDEGEYQDLLKAAAENVESFPKQANLRYLLHPIRVPGCFHPKVFLLAGARRGLLLIGSANFTQDGLGSNAELVAAFDYEEKKNEGALPLFQSALRFFEQLADRWPAEHLQSNINTLVAEVPWLAKADPIPAAKGVPVLLTNLERPLWDQLVERLPGPASRVSVLSRFFDAQPALVDFVQKSAKAKRLTLYTQNGITTLTKAWLKVPAFTDGDMDIRLCQYSDSEYFQQLHAKAYAFTCGKKVVLAIGSANFTTAALRRTAASGNLEVLLCYPPVAAKELSPRSWFDPDGTAVVLREANQLQTATDNTDEAPAPFNDFPVRITEAFVEEDWLKLKLAADGVGSRFSCRVEQSGKRPFELAVETTRTGPLRCRLDATHQQWLRAAPALAQLGVHSLGKWTPQSQLVLITNLQDVVTGRDVRSERQIREARESPQRFMDVLTMLCSGDDEERLKQFLTYCDIPIDLPASLLRRRTGPGPDGGTGPDVLSLGTRNLRHFEVLHDAVMDFVRRHQRRLNRHVERGTAKGIPNFLHILLTIGNLLLSQIERIVAALEAEAKLEMSADRWHQIRHNLDAYYQVLEELFEVTAVDYLDALLDRGSSNKISAEFGDSLLDLHNLLDRAIQNREKILQLQQIRLVVTTENGTVIGPGFFNSILSPKNWTGFVWRLMGLENQLKGRLVA
jgi:HKD family nuclease